MSDMPGSPNSSAGPAGQTGRVCLALLVAAVAWLAVTKAFWVGYAGSDDLYYSRYAFLFHRAPMNWWEARLPAVLAIRAAFSLFGPHELAAALPTLIAALAGTIAIAWFVRWPRQLNWQTMASVLIAVTLPLDVTFRTVPGASYLAAGLLITGSVCILKNGRLAGIAGCACFAVAIATHELSLFYAGIFLGTCLLFDRKRFLRFALIAALFTLVILGAQAIYYSVSFGDALLRFHLAAGESAKVSGLYDPDLKISGLQFLLWPVKTMAFSKVFAFDLLATFALGAVYWRRLAVDQRIMLTSGFLTWLYLGYGTKIPWAYKPLARMYHFYGPLVLCISVLLPVCIGYLTQETSRPRVFAIAAVAGVIALHLACLAAGGRWGQDVKVSKLLLEYAEARPASTYLTDIATMNQMYVWNEFRMPANIVCRNGPAAERDLLVNKEPPNPANPRGVTFPDTPIDGILLNLNDPMDGDPDFREFVAAHPAPRERIEPIRYKSFFAIAPAPVKARDFAIASQGAELISLQRTGQQ